MQYRITQSTAFPLAEIELLQGDQVRIERGAMVYHYGDVQLEGKLNSNGASGLGGLVKALGRSLVSNEEIFITTATSMANGAKLGIAPGTPGAIRALSIGNENWRLNDGAFLACDMGVQYHLKRQSFGKALFGGTGGFFVMETSGAGTLLVCSYGDILEIPVDAAKPLVVDNSHVVAWSSSLEYSIQVASGTFGFTTGEGLVNEFRGTGTVLLQTRNVQQLATMLLPFIPRESNH